MARSKLRVAQVRSLKEGDKVAYRETKVSHICKAIVVSVNKHSIVLSVNKNFHTFAVRILEIPDKWEEIEAPLKCVYDYWDDYEEEMQQKIIHASSARRRNRMERMKAKRIKAYLDSVNIDYDYQGIDHTFTMSCDEIIKLIPIDLVKWHHQRVMEDAKRMVS